jgi:cell division protein FtsL
MERARGKCKTVGAPLVLRMIKTCGPLFCYFISSQPHVIEVGQVSQSNQIGRRRKLISGFRWSSLTLANLLPSAFLNLIALIGILLVAPVSALAQQQARIDEISGRLEPDQIAIYNLNDLKSGETLYVYVEGISRGLDPLVALLQPGLESESIEEEIFSMLDEAASGERDPLTVINEVLDDISLAWNDDSSGTYDANLKYTIPSDGDHQLLVMSSIAHKTDGSYRLLIGVDAPQVLSGKAVKTDTLASYRVISDFERGAEEVFGKLSERTPFKVYHLGDIDPGDTLYVYVESLSDNLKPSLTLEDFGAKPIVDANYAGKESIATLQYTFNQDTAEWRIRVSDGNPDGNDFTDEDFRLIAGFNTPEVLEGKAITSARAVIRQPIPVKIGVEIHQIVSVDQLNESFTVVGDLLMEWRDPHLAYEPNPERPFKFFFGEGFHHLIDENAILWPQFIIFNQQGRRDLKARTVAVFPNGNVIYTEKFTATLQAPDFDFRRYPFDRQQFFISVDMVLPLWFFLLEEIEGFSQVGDRLGEEEWIVGDVFSRVEKTDYASRPVSRFTLGYEASRHLYYYVFRIFLPMLIIITVSWVLFFLRDYGKRVDAASANLLLFIAFNFTISNDLPRLGYLTLLDMFLISTFVVTAFVLVLAVYQKRMQTDGHTELVQRIDGYVLTFYPIAYLVGAAMVILFFE